jgi:type VI secretion system protein VasD
MRQLLITAALAVLGLVAGCTTVEKFNPFAGPATLKGEVAAGAQINPDARKRASPVVVRVFELKANAQFESADFVSLFEREQQVLGPDLVSREEFVLRPGEKRPLEKKLSPETKFIGVMVAFRELERARWRAVIPVAPNRTNIVAVSLDGIAVQATRTQPEIKP